MSFKRLKVRSDLLPQATNPTSECTRCVNFQEQFNEIKEREENLKLSMLDKLEQIEKNHLLQNKALMTVLAEHKILISKLIRQESLAAPIGDLFPICTDEALAAVDEKIFQDNRDIYVSMMRKLFQYSAHKNFRNILAESMIIRYNIDGTHGKQSLKSFKKFYAALLDAISQLPGVTNPEEQLRRAFRVQKKRHFKNAATANNQ
ncbi:PREDICTED: uncharacterized protein LOC108372819 isoform X1 [Rhagoletis zephyria]|uniref:uncharacterized protein LOC118757464 n=1 Tax=Rhagoletis pomonella TaxID=28610 RepID=UPI0008117CC2|nr:PREDICTED: uncharacterized protein LOC108372819 isoform X1 [Rhagoletis zephyria]XP_017484082.1 PREDICTED: uncharacterized protein LOC108372819 isoform X1 [Rhagoletis zephyria]XP_036348067.1 uncharacterized protein LOC118757464 [Rhagoletis pomonella]